MAEYPVPTAGSQPVGDGDGRSRRALVHRVRRQQDRPPPPREDHRVHYPDGQQQTDGGRRRTRRHLWFSEPSTGTILGKIGRITPNGAISEYSLASTGHPLVITAGAHGGMWFTESPGNRIGRIDPATGAVTEFAVPTSSQRPGRSPLGPTATSGSANCSATRSADHTFATRYGSLGGCVSELATTKTLWFTEQNANRIAQITPTEPSSSFRYRHRARSPAGSPKAPTAQSGSPNSPATRSADSTFNRSRPALPCVLDGFGADDLLLREYNG